MRLIAMLLASCCEAKNTCTLVLREQWNERHPHKPLLSCFLCFSVCLNHSAHTHSPSSTHTHAHTNNLSVGTHTHTYSHMHTHTHKHNKAMLSYCIEHVMPTHFHDYYRQKNDRTRIFSVTRSCLVYTQGPNGDHSLFAPAARINCNHNQFYYCL